MSADAAVAALVDPAAYADGRLERACDTLRHAGPIHFVDEVDFLPFHVLTKHRDIQAVERQPTQFPSGPRHRLRREREDLQGDSIRTLVGMDPPDHTDYRALAADWFNPRNLAVFEEGVRELARAAVDRMAALDEPYDFVTEVSMQLPSSVICSMLGIPESDRTVIIELTQLAFGVDDPEYRELAKLDGMATGVRFAEYFSQVAEDRRANPTDDLCSVLAHATVRGEPLPPGDLLGYYGILATAGHDTTSSTIAGGLRALVEHADELDRLRADPSLVATAAEEMIRWVTPVKSFMRTVAEDTELCGRQVTAGDGVMLLYPSANRDEDAFDDAHRFDVGRDPNRHLAFGHGIHFCLGAQLARLETRAFFAELIPRLRSIEIVGEPQLVKTLFVGGLKHLPIRAQVD
jgi:cytochrome P450